PLTAWSDWRVLLSLAVHGILVAVACFWFKKKDFVAFGVLFFFITLSVSSNLFIKIGTHIGERLLYTPSFGFCLAAASLLNRFNWKTQQQAGPSVATVAVAVVVILFSLKTWFQNPVWRSNETLYQSGVIRSPESFRTHYYLGLYMIKPEYYS